MRLHLVSFQVPFPPAYGGLIDVYYKLKALKRAGCSVVLHTYQYRIEEQPDLLDVADTVYYYERYTGWRSMFSFLPYIVYSRRNPLLLERLCQDDAPVLFEGLHTCYFLRHPRLKNRTKWVRMHNIESDYYCYQGKSSSSWFKKCYYYPEALRLWRFEKVLKWADEVFAITETDADYFSRRYPNVKISYLPCFFDSSPPDNVREKPFGGEYILYHGNLSVAENIKVVNYILKKLLPQLNRRIRVVIAGKDPGRVIKQEAAMHSNVSLIENPSVREMEQLIACARVHILFTFQSTGIKLKLVYALIKGYGHCLANSMMMPDIHFKVVCSVEDSPDGQVKAIHELYDRPLSPEYLQWRRKYLEEEMGYDNDVTSILR